MATIIEIFNQYKKSCEKNGVAPCKFIMKVLEKERGDYEQSARDVMHLRLCGNNHLITDTRLNDEDLISLSDALKEGNEYVTRIDLRYNNITDRGAEIIGDLLEKQENNIKELNLMCNDIGEEGAKALAKSLHGNESLLSLKLNGNKISNKGGMYFAQALQINSTLAELDVGDTDQKTQSIIALATVLNSNFSLKALNVNRALLFSQQEETTVHFANMLRVNHGLVELHLRKCDLKDFGATRLSEALKENMTLQYIDLACNQITRDGAKQLAELLKTTGSLKVLDLSANRVEDPGAIDLATALKTYNITLTSLSLTSNNINSDGLCALAKCLEMNSSLTNIYVWGNHFEHKSCTEFKVVMDSGRLEPSNTDIQPFVVDGVTSVAQASNGINPWYYYEPVYGENVPKHIEIENKFKLT